MLYNWLRALHIIGVVAWFAGLFYIFRLFVYHVENHDKPELVAVFKVMQRKLYRAICWPAMLFAATFGVALLIDKPGYYFAQPWFHAKLLGLLGLFSYHFYSGKVLRDLAADRINLTSRQCRIINEAPAVLLILIVVMVVVKPWTAGL